MRLGREHECLLCLDVLRRRGSHVAAGDDGAIAPVKCGRWRRLPHCLLRLAGHGWYSVWEFSTSLPATMAPSLPVSPGASPGGGAAVAGGVGPVYRVEEPVTFSRATIAPRSPVTGSACPGGGTGAGGVPEGPVNGGGAGLGARSCHSDTPSAATPATDPATPQV